VEKRAYIRQPVEVPARFGRPGAPGHVAVIRDFCLGGVFLDCAGAPGFERDSRVEIGFAASLRGQRRSFGLQARVAGLFKSGMGVEFLEPDPEALIALQEAAAAHRRAQATRDAERERDEPRPVPGEVDTSRLPAVRNELRQALSRFAEEQSGRVFEVADEALFAAARDAATNVEQNQCFDAQKELGRLRRSIESSFREDLLHHLDHLGESRASAEEEREDDGLSELSLVDTQSFTDWLAVKKILEKAEPRYRDRQFVLQVRLSALAGVRIDEENNPIGPTGVCFSFHDSLQNLGASRPAREAIFDAFDETVVARLGDLYDEVDQIFVRNGVLVDVRRPKPCAPKRSRSAEREDREPPPAQEPAADRDPWGDAGVPDTGQRPPGPGLEAAGAPAPGPSAPPAGGPAGGPAWPAPGPPGAPGAPAGAGAGAPARGPGQPGPGPSSAPASPGAGSAPPASSAPPAASGTGAPGAPGAAPAGAPGAGAYAPGMDAAAHAAVMEEAYTTARRLLDLGRHLRASPEPSGGAGGPPQAGTGKARKPAGPPLGTRDVVGALSRMQQEDAGGDWDDSGRQGLRERLFSALGEGSEGRLGEAENDAVEVISGLMRAIVEDPQVADPIKNRIRRLAVPLLRVAVEHSDFFSADSHPARRLVNQLGRLELPVASEDPGRPSLRSHVDPELERVVSGYDGDPELLGDVADRLEKLATQHDSDYKKNVAEVVTAFESQQRAITARRKPAGAGAAAARNMPEEWRQWLKRASRLKPGDALVVDRGAGRAECITLACVGDDANTFVFVDGEGNKAASLSLHELAMQLRRGEARLLDSAGLPVMDRGLYVMLREMHEQFRHRATHDAVTGLMKRKQFEERIERSLREIPENGPGHVLCLLDLDNFDEIRDTCGPRAGERLLRQLAGVLQKHVGSRGVLAGLGGDEFGLLLERAGLEDGLHVADRQRHAIDQSRCVWKGRTFPLSVSVGVVPITGVEETVPELMQRARAACDAAKEAGGNRVEVNGAAPATPEPGDGSEQDWEQRVDAVLREDRLVLQCQRVEPLGGAEGSKPHYEILVGVRGRNGSEIDLDEFLAAAARYQRLPDVDRWTIRAALEWMSGNRRKLVKSGGFAINLSSQSLADEKLMEYVIQQFSETGVPPGKVLFEVTESAAIETLSMAENFIRVLKEYGCRFALDDFGTANSSYAHLKTLPVDFVKIDGMFVKDIVSSHDDFAMVRSINEIGHFMNKKTIAQAAESDAIVERLREIGVDYAQGTGISATVPIDEVG